MLWKLLESAQKKTPAFLTKMHTFRTHSTAAILDNAIVTEPINSKNSTKSAYRLEPCKNSGKSELLNFGKSRLTCASTCTCTCLLVVERENLTSRPGKRMRCQEWYFLPLLFPFGNRKVRKLDDGQFFGLFWYKTRDFLFVSGSSFELQSMAIIWEKLKIEKNLSLRRHNSTDSKLTWMEAYLSIPF